MLAAGSSRAGPSTRNLLLSIRKKRAIIGCMMDRRHCQPGKPRTGDKAMAARTGQMTSFTYTTYIHATPERVWQGLTDPAFTRRYWRHQRAGEKTFRSDWKKAWPSARAPQGAGLAVAAPEKVIPGPDPCRQLAYTWHTFTPEW